MVYYKCKEKEKVIDLKNIYLVVKVNVDTNEMKIVSDSVFESYNFAQTLATDYNDNCFDASKWNYQVKELVLDDFKTSKDLEEE